MNTVSPINRIIAYGCSWTDGSELMDHVHMNVSFDECNKIKQSYINNGKTIDNMTMFARKYTTNSSENVERNHKHSWVGQLASLLNLPINNFAKGGLSLDHIYFQLFTDYINGKIQPTDLVIVGLTSPNRFINFANAYNISSMILGQHVSADNLEDRSLIDMFNDDFLMFNYFKTLGMIASLKNVINLRIQTMTNDINPNSKFFLHKVNHVKPYAKYIWDKVQDLLLLPDEYLREHIVDGKIKRCGFLHFPVESHTELANKIFNQVKLI